MDDGRKKSDVPSFVRRLACENSKYLVYLDDIETSEGQQVNNYLVIQPRVRAVGGITGVAVMPVMGGQVGLLRIYRHAIRDYVWEIPRGFIDACESERAAALRELEEETALECSDNNLISCGYVLPDAGVLDAKIHIFTAFNCVRRGPLSITELGHREFCLFGYSGLKVMMDDGLIQDPSTLIACMRFLVNHVPD